MQLQIRHIGTSPEGMPLFYVLRMPTREYTQSVLVTSPYDVKVGACNTDLRQELRWYLEKYLELPVDTFRMRADDIQAALSQWGRACFDTLFGSDPARGWYQAARQKGILDLCLKIVSDDPVVLSWPWEAIESKDEGSLARQCRIERQLPNLEDIPIPDTLLGDCLNILYIIARPSGNNDVGFQTMAQPVVEFVKSGNWPVHIDMLRPPTFDQLRAVLEKRPNFYHIIHFDGHGTFNNLSPLQPTGALMFEKDDANHSEDTISAAKLGELICAHNIPVMVLNACQSAMLDEQAKDAFSSVAASLLRAGVRSVVAMSHALWVRGAEVFVPAFYKTLFINGDVSGAMLMGRRAMFDNKMRDFINGRVAFNDWVVPVLYRQDAGFLPVLKPEAARKSDLPDEALRLDKYGFIGRDRSIKQLERAMRESPAGILISGMAGTGKTTLVRGFLQWLEATNGLGKGVFWFSFEGLKGIEGMINELLEFLRDTQVMSKALDVKISYLTNPLRQIPLVIVWDNFESASGIPDAEVAALLPEDERAMLKKLLQDLEGGETKILITSRSKESWIESNCYPLPLEGLQGEDLWRYCNELIRLHDLTLKRDDYYRALMEKLEGNPLAVRAILPRLAECPAEALLTELEDDFNGLESDDATRRIQAALSVFERGLDRAFIPVLRLLGLHECYADSKSIEHMLKKTGKTAPFEECFATLENAGLCRLVKNGIYQLHPALWSCLKRRHPAEVEDQRAFVDEMYSLADKYDPEGLHEPLSIFLLFGANFRRALGLARKLNMLQNIPGLIHGLAMYEVNIHNFPKAEGLLIELSKEANKYRLTCDEGRAYYYLGVVAHRQRHFDIADDRCKQACNIFQTLNDEHFLAKTYHQLGMIKQEMGDYENAERWYKQSLAIKLKRFDERGAAISYHQLGRLAQVRERFEAANDWYKQSLAIKLRLRIFGKYGIETAYHQLGRVAAEQKNYDAAVEYYKYALRIFKHFGDERNIGITYHNLGNVAEERGYSDVAEQWYKDSLKIKLKQRDEYGAAPTYHHLGLLAYAKKDYKTAEDWFKKSLEIKQRWGNKRGIALTTYQLGRLFEDRIDFAAAEDWYNQSLSMFIQCDDQHKANVNRLILSRIHTIKQGGKLTMTTPEQTLQELAHHDPDFSAFVATLPPKAFNATLPDGLAKDVATLLLAEYPELPDWSDAQQTTPPPDKLAIDLMAAGVLAAILFLLRSHIKIKGDHFSFEHKPMDSDLLKRVLDKLSFLLGGKPEQ